MNEKHNEQILEAIRNNDRRALQDFYNRNRELFSAWCIKKYHLTKDDSAEVYQQAYLILYKNVMSGKLEKLSSKPITYLCSVGRNIMLQRLRVKVRHVNVPIEEIEDDKESDFVADTEEEKERQEQNKKLVQHLLSKIGDPCASILKMLFVKGMHPEAVAHAMNYSDERVVRKRKSLCLKRLREMVKEEANQNSSQDT
ncbi:MAG: RNA polymerase sigma factor [Aureispira sp.]